MEDFLWPLKSFSHSFVSSTRYFPPVQNCNSWFEFPHILMRKMGLVPVVRCEHVESIHGVTDLCHCTRLQPLYTLLCCFQPMLSSDLSRSAIEAAGFFLKVCLHDTTPSYNINTAHAYYVHMHNSTCNKRNPR